MFFFVRALALQKSKPFPSYPSSTNRLPLHYSSMVSNYYCVADGNKWGGGTGGRETGRKGGGRCTGGGRRGGGKRDSQGGGKREKKGKITQHCAIFRNRKNAKGREPKNTGREPLISEDNGKDGKCYLTVVSVSVFPFGFGIGLSF